MGSQENIQTLLVFLLYNKRENIFYLYLIYIMILFVFKLYYDFLVLQYLVSWVIIKNDNKLQIITLKFNLFVIIFDI